MSLTEQRDNLLAALKAMMRYYDTPCGPADLLAQASAAIASVEQPRQREHSCLSLGSAVMHYWSDTAVDEGDTCECGKWYRFQDRIEASPPLDTGPQKGCINCGEANDGGYEVEDGPGPFCSGCWDLLQHHFFAEANEIQRKIAASPPLDTGEAPTEKK